MSDKQAAMERALEAKRAHEEELMTIPNVVAVGVGMRSVSGKYTDEIAVVVSVSQKYASDVLDEKDMIPSQIDGVPVDVQQIGDLRAIND